MLCVECFAHFVDIFWVDHFCLNVLTRILTGNASILQIREKIYRMKPKLRQQQYKKKSERKKCSNGYSLIFEMKWFAVVIRFFFLLFGKERGGKKKKIGIDWRTLIRFWNKIMFVFFLLCEEEIQSAKKKKYSENDRNEPRCEQSISTWKYNNVADSKVIQKWKFSTLLFSFWRDGTQTPD